MTSDPRHQAEQHILLGAAVALPVEIELNDLDKIHIGLQFVMHVDI